jgi:hypothetical protein
MDAVETLEYKGHAINIYQDDCDESPREWDNLCEFHCWHRRMNLGDENYNPDNDNSRDELNQVLKEAQKNNDIVLPLYCYEHSGIVLSLGNAHYPFNDTWDAGQVGYVIIRRKKAFEELMNAPKIMTKEFRKRCIEIAEGEVKTYNQYLCGDIYGYVIGDDGDSCWGFYGIEDVISEAKGVVDWNVENTIKEHCKQVKQWIKNKVPLIYREHLTII